MTIYGLTLLSFCYLVGQLVGQLLGKLIGIDSNVGGVGFAMLMLIILHDLFSKKGWMNEISDKGITFWSSMYIPIIVGMSASQNVKQALSSGMVAILAGTIPVIACYLLIPTLSKMLKD
jgi:malonate transporter MadL subunit